MKRFSESTKWADPWFRNLPIESKCLWLWLLDNCDCAGIIEPDMGLATFQIGATKPLASPFDLLGDRIEMHGGKLFIPKFIKYQYGTELQTANTAHRGVIKRLEMANIPCPVSIIENQGKAPTKGLPRGYQAPQDKDKDMDKDKDTDKDTSLAVKKKREPRPTLDQIKEYMQTLGLPETDAAWLDDKWEGNGYKNGGKPILSWKATIRTWKAVGDIFPSQKQGKQKQMSFGMKTNIADRHPNEMKSSSMLEQLRKKSTSYQNETTND